MKKRIVILTAFLLFLISNAYTATYYVSPSGSDSNDGSSTSPWATPGYASKQLAAGDTLIIRGGTYIMDTYYEDMITPEVSGTSSAWITIKGEEGNRPIIAGRNSLLAAIEIGGRSYIKIENLEIKSDIDTPYTGGFRGGIEAGGSGGGSVSSIEIKNVEIHHVEEAGINFAGNINNVTVENVHIHHTGGPSISAPPAEGGSGWVNVSISGCILEYAGLFSNGQEVPSNWDRPDGLGFEDSEGPVEIKNTISRYNYGDGLDSKAKNTYIHNCIVANNYGDGVKLWGSGSKVENTLIYGTGYPRPSDTTPWALLVIDTDDPNARIDIINCTLFDDDRRPAHYAMTIQYDYCSGQNQNPITVVMKNNIIAGLHRVFIRNCVNLIAENNLFYNRTDPEGVQVVIDGVSTYTSNNISSLGPGNIYGDPLFIRPEWGPNGDFHLQSGSPAIDNGSSSNAPSIDLEYNSRPLGSSFDIGAYEYTPSQSYSHRIYFPHIASNSIWETEIAIINISSENTLNGELKAYNDSGQQVSSKTVSLSPHGRREITIGDEFTSASNIGYIIFEADSDDVRGYTKFYTESKYRVAIPAVREINTGDIYLSHIASKQNWWTGVSFLNTNSSSLNLTIEFNTGQEKTVTLAANEHKVFTISSLFNGQPQPDIESGVIKNANGVIGLELFGSTEGSENSYLSGILLRDDTTTEIYYPHIASDSAWWTGMVAYNPSSSPCTLTITPITATGNPLTSQTLLINGKGKYIGTAATLNLPENTAWLKIEGSSAITGFELFGTNNGKQLAGYTGVGITGKEGIFAKLEQNGGWTGIALVNIEDTLATVTLTAYDDSGNSVATTTLNLSGYEKVVSMAESLFNGQGISGGTYISYSSDKDVVGFQLNGSSDEMMLDGLPGM